MGPNPISLVSLKKQKFEHRKDDVETQKGAHLQARECLRPPGPGEKHGADPSLRPSKGTNPVDTVMADFKQSEPWDRKSLLLKPPSLWYFALAALGNSHTSLYPPPPKLLISLTSGLFKNFFFFFFYHSCLPKNLFLFHFLALVALAGQTGSQCVYWNKPDPKESPKKRTVWLEGPCITVFLKSYTSGITRACMSALFLQLCLHVIASVSPKLHLEKYLLLWPVWLSR